LSPEEQLARRADKKVIYDQIRGRKQENGQSGPTAGNRHAEGPVEEGAERPRQSEEATLISVYIRQRWVKVLYHERMMWARLRRYLKRKFRLKKWRCDFEEKLGKVGVLCLRTHSKRILS
jgi:hypothetical protein